MSLLDATEELLASIDRSIATVTRVLNGATARMHHASSAMDLGHHSDDISGDSNSVGGASSWAARGVDPWDGYGDTWGYYQVERENVPMYRDLYPETQEMIETEALSQYQDDSTVAPLQLEADEDMTVVNFTPFRYTVFGDEDSDTETVVDDWIDPTSSPAFYDSIRRQPIYHDDYETESELSLYLE